MPRTFKARDLRVVDNTTADWDGGFTVESGPKDDPTIEAGPFAAKADAKLAKQDLVTTGVCTRRS